MLLDRIGEPIAIATGALERAEDAMKQVPYSKNSNDAHNQDVPFVECHNGLPPLTIQDDTRE